jgi:hypothetical protein
MSLDNVNGAPTALAAEDAKKDYMARVYKMTHAELFHELMRVHTASAQMINELQAEVEKLTEAMAERDGGSS